MQILAVHRTPTLTQERYDRVVRGLTGGKSRIASSDDLPFDGLLAHGAGQSPDGFVVVDMFASERAVEDFRAAVAGFAAEAGIEEPPTFFSAHTVFIA
jgi:hypothetical protein